MALSVTPSLTLSIISCGTVCHTITYPLHHQPWHWLSHYHLSSVTIRGTVCHTITYPLHHQPWHCHTITYPLRHQPWHWLSYYRLPSPSSAVALSVTLSFTLSINSRDTVCHTITYPLCQQPWHCLSHYHLPSPSSAMALAVTLSLTLSINSRDTVTLSLILSVNSRDTVCHTVTYLLHHLLWHCLSHPPRPPAHICRHPFPESVWWTRPWPSCKCPGWRSLSLPQARCASPWRSEHNGKAKSSYSVINVNPTFFPCCARNAFFKLQFHGWSMTKPKGLRALQWTTTLSPEVTVIFLFPFSTGSLALLFLFFALCLVFFFHSAFSGKESDFRLTKQQNTDHAPQTSLCGSGTTLYYQHANKATEHCSFFPFFLVLWYHSLMPQRLKTTKHWPHTTDLTLWQWHHSLLSVCHQGNRCSLQFFLCLLLYCPKTLTVVLTLSSIPPVTVITPTKQLNTDIKVETLNSREHTTYFKERQKRLLILRPFCSVCKAFHTHLGFVTVGQGRKRDGLTLSI